MLSSSFTGLSKIREPVSSLLTNRLVQLTNQFINYTTDSKPYQISTRPNQFYGNLFIHLRSPQATLSLSQVRKLHALLQIHGFFHPSTTDVRLAPQLVNIYVSFHCLQEALLVFNQLVHKNGFAWNSILRGFVNVGHFSKTIEFFRLMLKEGVNPDNFTYPLVLKACSGLSALEEGRKIQTLIKFNEIQGNVKPNIFVECAMIDMFAKCGSLDEGRKVFDKMPTRDLVSWSAIICGTVQNGEWLEALLLFKRMIAEGFRPDSVIVATILPACGRLRSQLHGMALQGCAWKSGFDSDLYVSNALIDMYAKCGDTYEARCVFNAILNKDDISWNTMIAAHSQNCEYRECLKLYVEMKHIGMKTNIMTVASVLPGFANLKLLKQGREMHNYVLKHGFESDIVVGSALIDMYSNCGFMRQAGFIFDIMSNRDITIWNSMIVGYALNGDIDSAFGILRRVGVSEIRVNAITIVSVLPLCSRMGLVRPGKEIHSQATRIGLGAVVSVGNALINMYCKCGFLEHGVQVFNQMVEKNIVTYNTVIAAHGMNGHGEQAFSFFSKMNETGIKPNKVTFVAMLSACSHAGLIDRGWFLYNSMTNNYGILPDMEHFSCMVDLLARSGHLDDAWEFVNRIPVKPDINVLGSLLAACRLHHRVELAELVGRELFQINTEGTGYYVLLSNIYASKGKWADASKVRSMIKEKGLTKKPGNSWIQVGHVVHSFHAKDRMYKEFNHIQEILECLMLEMKDEGYLPDISFSSSDLIGDDKLMQFK